VEVAEATFQTQPQDQHKTAVEAEVVEQAQDLMEPTEKAAEAAEWVKTALLQMVQAVTVL
tara:strand:+ start:365 stop:544 length:180 start_codon:yes stop_codon:yes gene_type:complete